MTNGINIISKKIIVKTRGIDCVCHVWHPRSPANSTNSVTSNGTQEEQQKIVNYDGSSYDCTSKPRGVVVIFHGLGAHAQFPTVKYLAILLARHSFIVYGMDFPGHGESPGLRGYIDSAENLISDGISVTLFAKKMHSQLPLFLAGGSLGGAIALAVTHELHSSTYNTATGDDGGINMLAGLVLMAPMISLPNNIPKCQICTLTILAKICPKLALFPPSSPDYNDDDDDDDDDHHPLNLQFRDKQRRLEVHQDKLSYQGSLRVASAFSCWKLMKIVHQSSFSTLSIPFLLQLGTEDVVVDNDIAKSELMGERIPSKDKTLKEYDALHGLLCEELPLRTQIEKDILQWLSRRTIISPNLSKRQILTTTTT
uniref:Serine aminopeptidase S33 domain-containing protein n=1 Tax=Eucampia antarctica TaxID=49252 RepID=A0A7S2QZE9_9STRA|mmetsp:Transcript_10000/g.9688  ORF Transcript_10000/g.9688 Transcript_10000/m.9688 type:complete len:369 (+) Transcript_10000:67-1173(+)